MLAFQCYVYGHTLFLASWILLSLSSIGFMLGIVEISGSYSNSELTKQSEKIISEIKKKFYLRVSVASTTTEWLQIYVAAALATVNAIVSSCCLGNVGTRLTK